MARALFKSWFVHFDPVRAKAEGRAYSLPKPVSDLFPSCWGHSDLGEIPRGWQYRPLGDRSLLDTRQHQRVSVTISDVAEGVRHCLRAYPRRRAARFLLESPSIPGDCEGNDRIRTVWDTRGFAAH